MGEEVEGRGRRTGGRTGAEEKRRGEERIRGKVKTRGVERSAVQKRRGKYKFHADQLKQVNQENDPEKDLERGVTGRGSPPLQRLPLPLKVLWSSQ